MHAKPESPGQSQGIEGKDPQGASDPLESTDKDTDHCRPWGKANSEAKDVASDSEN